MSIQLGIIAPAGGEILTEAGVTPGVRNLVSGVVKKIPRHDHSTSYQYESNVIHYRVENEIIYLCMADKDAQHRIAFAFLDEVMKRFKEKFSTDGRKYPFVKDLSKDTCSKFNATMSEQLKIYNDPNTDKLRKVRQQVEDVKVVMLENIDSVLQRGDKIDTLVDKTNELNT